MGNNESNQKKEPPIAMIKRLGVNLVLLVILCVVLMTSMKSLSGKRQAELKQLEEVCENQKNEIEALNKQVLELKKFIDELPKKK